MTFRFNERPNSVRTTTNPPTYEKQYVAAGEFDANIVRAYAAQQVPQVVATEQGFLFLDDIAVQEQGQSVFYVTPRYVTQDAQKPPVGSMKFAFSTTGGSFHVTHSKSTVNRYPSTAVDYKQAINVRTNGNDLDIDGADIIIPALKLTYTFNHPQGFVNESHARNLASITGCVNDSVFRGFAAGEVLFLGADGSDGTNSEAEVACHFACESNLQALVIGAVTGIEKNGHDLLWVNSKKDTDSGKPTVVPLGVYIERVYRRVNLAAALGWG